MKHKQLFIQINCVTASWTVVRDPSRQIVTLRSTVWPGYSFYIANGTGSFGSVYFGYGQKNLDVGFML